MSTTPQLTRHERFNGLAFRALLEATARPGTIGRLPAAVESGKLPLINSQPPAQPALATFMSLLDQQTGFAVATDGRWLPAEHALTLWIALRSRAQAVTAAQADYVLMHDLASLPLIVELKRGSLSYPEQSATVFCLVEAFDGPPVWELYGPGIAGRVKIRIAGMNALISSVVTSQRDGFPLGIDLYFIDRGGNCLAIPRSSTISPLGAALEATWAM